MQLGALSACNKVCTTPRSHLGQKSYTGPAHKASTVSRAILKGVETAPLKHLSRRVLSFGPSSFMGQDLSLGMPEGPSRRTGKKHLPVVRASAEDGDIVASKTVASSQGTVLPYVAVACLGAILFGYHLGVVNGALEYLAKDLGIASNTVLQGWVVSSTLAGATIGSFTGGALADQFGCTRTFQLDAVPLIVGAILRFWLF